MKKLLAPILFLAFLCFASTSFAQNIVGTWKTVDDETNEAKSYIEIYEKDGKYFGKCVKILREEHVNDVCTNCSDYRKDKPIMGMEIVSNMKKDGDEYNSGKILDPEKGKIYTCKIWKEGENLKVRGYVAFLYRTQTWYPVK